MRPRPICTSAYYDADGEDDIAAATHATILRTTAALTDSARAAEARGRQEDLLPSQPCPFENGAALAAATPQSTHTRTHTHIHTLQVEAHLRAWRSTVLSPQPFVRHRARLLGAPTQSLITHETLTLMAGALVKECAREASNPVGFLV